jgi:hypothetical protein
MSSSTPWAHRGEVSSASAREPSGASASPTSSLIPHRDEPAGFTLIRLALLLILMIFAARFLNAPTAAAWAVVAVVTVWGLASSAFWATPFAGSGMSWLLATGFLTHRTGDLSFTASDRNHLSVLMLAALVALLIHAVTPSEAGSPSPEYWHGGRDD